MKHNMKNKVFTSVVVLVSIILAVLWSKENNYNSRMRDYNRMMKRIEFRVQILRLKAETLKTAVEMLNLADSVHLKKGEKIKSNAAKSMQGHIRGGQDETNSL